jgi:hypothetical protein
MVAWGHKENMEYALPNNPKTKLSDLSVTEESKNQLKVTTFKKVPYGVVESFAQEFQDLKDEFDDDLTENNWDFSSRYASADIDMMEYGANRSGNSYVIFIGNKTKSFYSDSLMESIANAFIELYEELGESPYDDEDEYAKGGEIGQELMGGQPNQEKPSGAILLEVRKKGKEIVVTEDDGKTKEVYVKSNDFSGYTLHYKGNQYEFAYSLDSYAKGGNVYSSLELYIVKVYDGETGELLDMSKKVWATNLQKAKEEAIYYLEDNMKQKYGDYNTPKVVKSLVTKTRTITIVCSTSLLKTTTNQSVSAT